MSTLTCRCRYCGYTICYSADNIGADARCPQCGQTFRLPGKLATVSTIVRRRRKDRLGIGLEAIGFLCMFFFVPWGLLTGIALITIGWRRTNVLVCENCGTRQPHRAVESCPECRCKFGSDS